MKSLAIRLLKTFIRPAVPIPFNKKNIRNILVIRQHDQLGDMLCAIPLLRALRTRFPRSYITLVTSPVNHEIMCNHPYLDHVLNYDKKRFLKSPAQFLKFVRTLRRGGFDLAIVPATVSVSATSDILALTSSAGIRVGPASLQGQDNPTSFCFTTKIALDWKSSARTHQTRRDLDVIAPLGITTEDLSCVIGLTAEEREEARSFLASMRAKHPIMIGFHPGAGKIANRWDAEKFASIANRVGQEHNAGIIITAGPMDDEPVQRMKRGVRCAYQLVHNQPLRKVAAIIDQLDLYVTNDTGVMHVAAGVSANVLALFGPTDPLEWAPVGQKNRYIAGRDGRINSISEEEVFAMINLILMEIQQRKKLN